MGQGTQRWLWMLHLPPTFSSKPKSSFPISHIGDAAIAALDTAYSAESGKSRASRQF